MRISDWSSDVCSSDLFGFYRDGVRLGITRTALAATFPTAQPRVVIFVHGLCCNETAWQLYQQADDDSTRPYGEKLGEHGYTPLYLRYNSGAHITPNGRRDRKSDVEGKKVADRVSIGGGR